MLWRGVVLYGKVHGEVYGIGNGKAYIKVYGMVKYTV